MSIHPGVVRAALRGCRPLLASRRITVGGKRRMYDLFTRVARVPRGTGYDGVTIAGVPVEGVRPPGVDSGATLLYLHGGAYALGSAKGYRGVVTRLADAAGMTALVPDYSRSPEARYPVALEEMVAVYQSFDRLWGRAGKPCHCGRFGGRRTGVVAGHGSSGSRDPRPGSDRLDLPVGRPRD